MAEYSEIHLPTKFTVRYDPDLPQFGDLSPMVRSEIMERVAFCMATPAYLAPMFLGRGSRRYGEPAPPEPPAHVTITIAKQMAYVEADGRKWYEGGEPGYLPVLEHGLSTELWGIVVTFYDGEESSNPIYRTQYGDLAHYM